MEIVQQQTEKSVKQQLHDILLEVSWAKISQKYFGKSSSWIYHKLDGIDGNGGTGGFTDEEKVQFKNALFDFSDRVRSVAYKIQ
ncbi:hypothetical protein FACS1894176_09430 [Bacteroidia bacterium]|nr:hypothetical protein FACS1894176_09430 [Bacteroidia bacterium]